MSVERLLFNAAEQFVSFVGIVFLVGFIISLLNRAFYGMVGSNRTVLYVTSLVGTPIHELSHAAMCIVFGHRISEIKLFQMNSADGTLGYVKHSSNPKNPYQQIGCYFISVAPIIVSSVFLFLIMKNFIPATYKEIEQAFGTLGGKKAFSWFLKFDETFVDILSSLFRNMGDSVYSWIFVVFSMCVALHMNLSHADIMNSLRSLPLIAVLLVALNLILGYASRSVYYDFIRLMSRGGLFLALMLSLALVISLLYVILAFILHRIFVRK